jgi:hypothetical protein
MTELPQLPLPLFDRAMTPSERRKLLRLIKPKWRGLHAAETGTGPLGETCGTCLNLIRTKAYLKCGRVHSHWTGGAATDVHAKDPACSKWV